MPFFKLVKNSGPVQWTLEAEEVLQSLKRYLASPPILVAPIEKDPMLLYIAPTNQVVSVVLVVERDAPSDRVKGKHRENTLPGQPNKKRASGNDSSKDPQPNEPTCVAKGVAEEISLEAIPLKAKYVCSAGPAEGSPTHKVQHPVYFVSSVF